jgi:hypothetical protein
MQKPPKIIKIFETKNICKKVYFGTKEAADKHIARRSKEEKAKPATSYLCHKCNCWHTTSWTAPDIHQVIEEINDEIDRLNEWTEQEYEKDTRTLSNALNQTLDLIKENKRLELENFVLKQKLKLQQ